MGRVIGTQGEDCRFVEKFYDALGRPSGTTNPSDAGKTSGNCRWYSIEPYSGILDKRYNGSGWPIAPTTTTTYDKSGRVTKVTAPGNAEYKTEYYGDRVRKIDPDGKKRDFYSNSLGQLIEVIEDPGGLNYITDYTYDALGKLIEVYQKGNNSSDTQTRTFTYDSLGRLLEADNPEASDTTVYAYDDAGNMTSKTDARNVTTTVTYDELNRISVRSYSDGTPTDLFCYDGKVRSGMSCVTPGTAIPFSIGRLTVSNSGYNERNVHAFDAMGRVLSDSQTTVLDSLWTTATYTFSYTYYRNGAPASETYPSGKTINYTYDTNNRPDAVSESGGDSFVLGRHFADHGGVEEIEYGNFLRQKYCFNDRLQITGTELSSHATPYGVEVDCVENASNLITLNFDYGSDHHNNGNIVGQTIEASAEEAWEQYYTYDGTNRLAMASENAAITGSTCPGGATWCRKYGYDHFGNRWISASLDTLHMATPTAQSAVSLATNRLTSGSTYDAAGNLTAQTFITTGGGAMAYDANNKVTSFTATGVSVATKYDAAGRRVRKIYNSETTIWVYDAFGKLAAEYSTETQTTPVGTYYRTTDHLGSTRLVTDDLGRVRQRHDFFPFGEQIPASASFGDRQDVIDGGFATYNASLSVRQQFTGQQRDEETGLDYFWARNMAAPLGRFLSMDPGGAGARSGAPQSWNAFGYTNNSPLGSVDPDGRATITCEAEKCVLDEDPPIWGFSPRSYDFRPQGDLSLHPENQLCQLYGGEYCLNLWEEYNTLNQPPQSPTEVERSKEMAIAAKGVWNFLSELDKNKAGVVLVNAPIVAGLAGVEASFVLGTEYACIGVGVAAGGGGVSGGTLVWAGSGINDVQSFVDVVSGFGTTLTGPVAGIGAGTMLAPDGNVAVMALIGAKEPGISSGWTHCTAWSNWKDGAQAIGDWISGQIGYVSDGSSQRVGSSGSGVRSGDHGRRARVVQSGL